MLGKCACCGIMLFYAQVVVSNVNIFIRICRYIILIFLYQCFSNFLFQVTNTEVSPMFLKVSRFFLKRHKEPPGGVLQKKKKKSVLKKLIIIIIIMIIVIIKYNLLALPYLHGSSSRKICYIFLLILVKYNPLT